MGNNATSDSSSSSLCGFNMLSTECLRKTSLKSLKTTPTLSRIPSHHEKTAETKHTDISTLKDVADTPDSNADIKSFPSPDRVPAVLTEKDFRILEVEIFEKSKKVLIIFKRFCKQKDSERFTWPRRSMMTDFMP